MMNVVYSVAQLMNIRHLGVLPMTRQSHCRHHIFVKIAFPKLKKSGLKNLKKEVDMGIGRNPKQK